VQDHGESRFSRSQILLLPQYLMLPRWE
jgi:hypothetical protein